MRVKVRAEGREREVEVGEGTTVEGLLEELGYDRESVLVRKGKKLVVEEERLSEGDELEILRVVTGG
ncbi:MAG: MoaD/ThiS family protein [Candidatus Hadarchaeales archaeon]